MSSWWSKEAHADRRPALIARGAIKKALRAHFEADGFTEVECSALAESPGNEAHLHAFQTELISTGGDRRTLYLHTSPEFASKKLLAAGETKIFDFARVFRNREQTGTHAPEFTMLEWYRANETYESVIRDCLNVVRVAADTTKLKMFSYRARECDPHAEAQHITVGEAFEYHAGIDLLKTLTPLGEGDRNALAYAAKRGGFDVAEDDT
ncbi:MAG TPA: amino acid--tRNA ligase-related protein, partial [Rhizomicrobium sp.]|nr:amino acid--tRNA ligase-related protein [Rhizomicrobium sp.]